MSIPVLLKSRQKDAVSSSHPAYTVRAISMSPNIARSYLGSVVTDYGGRCLPGGTIFSTTLVMRKIRFSEMISIHL